MFVTMAEGAVEPAREAELLAAWAETTGGGLPEGLIESSLLRTETGTWRIVTVWQSLEAVLKMRASGEPPAALRMLEAAGARPTVSTWTVEGRVSAN